MRFAAKSGIMDHHGMVSNVGIRKATVFHVITLLELISSLHMFAIIIKTQLKYFTKH